MKEKDVLFIVTSHDKLGDTGNPTGLYLSGVSYPYKKIVEAGFEVDFVSPRGGKAPVEEADLSDPVNQWFQNDHTAQEKISNTLKPEEVDPANYPVIYYVGGHGTVWDFTDNNELQDITRNIWEKKGIVASMCHGSVGLINVKLSDGNYLVNGKKMTAFSNAEEEAQGTRSVVPFLVEDELSKHGAKLENADSGKEKVITDGRLITGQNAASAKAVGDVIVQEYRKLLYQEYLR